MRRRTVTLVVALAFGAAPAGAAAAPSASVAGGALTVTGDAGTETYTIDQSGTDVHVHTPSGVSGSVAPCTISGGNDIKCPTASISLVNVNGGGGEDTLNDNRVVPLGSADTLHGNAANDHLTHAS